MNAMRQRRTLVLVAFLLVLVCVLLTVHGGVAHAPVWLVLVPVFLFGLIEILNTISVSQIMISVFSCVSVLKFN